jgi:hypothetical protein
LDDLRRDLKNEPGAPEPRASLVLPKKDKEGARRHNPVFKTKKKRRENPDAGILDEGTCGKKTKEQQVLQFYTSSLCHSISLLVSFDLHQDGVAVFPQSPVPNGQVEKVETRYAAPSIMPNPSFLNVSFLTVLSSSSFARSLSPPLLPSFPTSFPFMFPSIFPSFRPAFLASLSSFRPSFPSFISLRPSVLYNLPFLSYFPSFPFLPVLLCLASKTAVRSNAGEQAVVECTPSALFGLADYGSDSD